MKAVQVNFRVPVIRLGSQGLGTTSDSAGSHPSGSQPALWVMGQCTDLRLAAYTRRPQAQRRPGTSAFRRKMGTQPDEAQLLHVRI